MINENDKTCSSEFVGKMPARTDLEVFPADKRPKLNIGWICQVFDGGEVLKEIDGQYLTKFEDLQIGDIVYVPSLFGGYAKMTVIKDRNEIIFASNESVIADLSFDKDSRHCWTSSSMINKKLINHE